MTTPVGLLAAAALQTAPLPSALQWTAPLLPFVFFCGSFALFAIGLVLPFIGAFRVVQVLAHKREPRSVALLWLLVIVVSAASWLFGWQPIRGPLSAARRAGIVRMTRSGRPLIHALAAYRRANGRYPAALDGLVPAFLDRVPATGAAGYPHFGYRLPEGGRGRFGSYELRVNTSLGMLNWDSLVYWPERNYPGHMYGGRVERIGDWAYVHE
uniref:Uncharacterized protein n=1 Tax=uncultured Armatimonadetes bacterium TaxID=157466 RepID=A0A6J4JWL6_9BACT|nr:hypothetical protein AVDCRST_MAG63-4278 [uncultured Armatimonadetes bacterium]